MKVINKINHFFSRISYKNIIYYCLCMFILITIAYLINEKATYMSDTIIYILGGKSIKESSLMNMINVLCFVIIILKCIFEYIDYALNKQYYLVCYRMESKKKFHVQKMMELIWLLFMYTTIFFFLFICLGLLSGKRINNRELVFLLQTYLYLFVGLMPIISLSYLFIFLFKSISLSLIVIIIFICMNLIGIYFPIGSFVVINEIMRSTLIGKFIYVMVNFIIAVVGFMIVLIVRGEKND